jgi:hypothetical protein
VVTISSSVSGATIRYTLDGSNPIASSPVYSSPLTLTSTATLNAAAFLGTTASPIASAGFVIVQPVVVAPPMAAPAVSSFAVVTISNSTPNSVIHYTLDGSDPTLNSPVYNGALNLTSSCTVKAASFLNGISGPISSIDYTLGQSTQPSQPTQPGPQPAAGLTVNPAGGSFAAPVSVTIAGATSGATIYYTLDGTNPTVNSPVYTGALTISFPVTLKASAFSGTVAGPVASAVFNVANDPTQAAYWKFDEGAGNTVASSSGNAANVLVNARWATGSACHTGSCLSFNGTSNYASTSLDLSATRTITVSFWMNWTAYADNDHLALEFSSGPYGMNSSTSGFMIDPNSSLTGASQFEVALIGDAGYNQLIFPRPSAGVWHHYAFVLDKSAPADNQITPYVDGTRVAYDKVTNAPNTNNFGNNNLFFMSRLGTSLFGSGMMDEVRIFSRALSPAEVQALAAQ